MTPPTARTRARRSRQTLSAIATPAMALRTRMTRRGSSTERSWHSNRSRGSRVIGLLRWPRRATTSAGLRPELDRRAKVVGIFPNTASLMRLFIAVLQDQHDEWQDGRRHFSQQSMARLLHPDGPPLLTNPLTGGIAA